MITLIIWTFVHPSTTLNLVCSITMRNNLVCRITMRNRRGSNQFSLQVVVSRGNYHNRCKSSLAIAMLATLISLVPACHQFKICIPPFEYWTNFQQIGKLEQESLKKMSLDNGGTTRERAPSWTWSWLIKTQLLSRPHSLVQRQLQNLAQC